MMMAPEDFIAEQAKRVYPLPPQQLSALRLFLTDLAIPIPEIAQLIVASETQYDRGILWRAIADGIESLTDFNDRFVDLVVAIQKVPSAGENWTTMTEYQMHWTEFAYDFIPPRSSDPNRHSKRQAWINMNAFCAKISLRGISVLDERVRACFVLKQALEQAPWESSSHPDIEAMLLEDPDDEVVAEEAAYQLECRDVRVLEYWAPAAAVWMTIDAEGIYTMEGKMSEADELDWYPGLWKGRKGWSRERFAFWRERFEWIGAVEELSEETREDAREAARCMAGVIDGKRS